MSIKAVWQSCLLLLMTVAATLNAQTISDFQQNDTWQIINGDKKNGTLTTVSSPMRQGNALQFAWDTPRDKYFEIYLKEQHKLDGFDSSAKPYHASISVDVFSPGTAEITRMSVRLIDGEGEVFQYMIATKLEKEGWQTLTFDIKPGGEKHHWGGKQENPGKMDGQVRFVGMTLDFDSRVEPAQESAKRRVFFDDLKIQLPSQAAVTANAVSDWQTLEDFDSGRVWNVYKPEDFNASNQLADSPQRQGKSLLVKWDLPRAKYFENYATEPVKLVGLDISDKPYHATIKMDVYSPGTAEVSNFGIRLRDAEQETFQWSARVDLTEQGWQTVTFEITPDTFNSNWGGKNTNPKVIDGEVTLVGMAVGFNGGVAASDDAKLRRLYLDDIRIQLPQTAQAKAVSVQGIKPASKSVAGPVALDRIKVGLNTGHPMHIVDPASPQPAFMTLTNQSSKSQEIVLDIKATSFLGREYALRQKVQLPAQKTIEHFLPLPQDKQDLWWIYYTLSDPNSSDKISDRELLGVMTPTGKNPEYQPKDRFLFGMCAHSGRYDDQTMQLEAYATGLIGVDVMRGSMTWGSVNPAKDVWKWEKMDRIVELYKQQNVEIQYIFAYTPRWATTGDPNSKDWLAWSRATPQLEPWKEYIAASTSRYKDDIRFWELWNEPDLGFFRGTPEEYVQMCKVAYPILKQNAPKATMLSGGWSAANRNPGFIENVLSQNADTYDILALHGHGFFGSYQKIIDVRWGQLRNQYAKGKPFYANETGLSSPGDTIQADTQQAVELVRKITFTMGRGAMAYNWYDLRHDGDSPNDHEHRYGMITRDFQAKPAYMAYNTLIGTLRGYKFVKQITPAQDQWMFLFEKDDHYALVGWAQQPYAIGQIVLHSDSKTVEHVDMMGNRQTMPRLSDGSVVVNLEMQPAYWVFDKASKAPDMTDSLIELPGVAAWIPDQKNDLEFNFTNPLKNKANFSFRVQLPRSLGGAVMQFDRSIDAGKTVAMSLPMGLVSGDVDYARPFSCIMQYQDDNYQLNGSCQIPIQWAGVIAKGKASTQPTFTVDHRDQVFDLYIGDPATRHRLWTGPKDLSAQTWIWATAKAVNLRIVVNDDKHVQPNPENQLWKSDCIQLAMQLPGQNGQWEINLGRSDAGQAMVNPGIVPQGLDASAVNHDTLKTTQHDGKVIYELTLPFSALSITPEKFAEGVYLSMLVNDDDGHGRDGWIALSSGIGNGKDPTCYPLFIVK
ncbi:MAG: endo-1,4-beta-xylanase [Phycisphaeraceae bacterium JB051]